MTNLLPLHQKKVIAKIYRLRLLSVFFWILSGVVVVALTLLLPSFFIIQTEKINLEQQLGGISNYNEQSTEIDEATFLVDKAKLAVLTAGVGSYQTASYVHKTLLNQKTDAIKITRFSYDLQTKEELIGKVSVNGVANNRKSLELFVEDLNKNPLFADIEDPISNYINEMDLPFSIILNIVKYEE